MKSIYKVPRGKLIRVDCVLDQERNEKIKAIKITGDFFCHPEEKFNAIEQGLYDTYFEEAALLEKIKKIIHEEKLSILGFSPEDLAKDRKSVV